ncbi:MAG: hypothetical protein ACRDRI_08150 [Pseudonocardiaceae bacterium]
MRMGTASTLDKTFVLVGTLCLAGNQYKVPSVEFWQSIMQDRGYFVIVFLGIVGVFGAFAPFSSWAALEQVDRSVTAQTQMLSHFGKLIELGQKVNPALTMNDLGLHVWRVRRSLKHPIKGSLLRVSTYRLGTTPGLRAFRPVIGEGVVGLCWKFDREYSVDVEMLSDSVDNEARFRKYREENGPDSVMNLSWRQFDEVRHRGAVFASPVRNGRNKFVGCVSVDASRGFTSLGTDELWSELNSVCLWIRQAGFGGA